MVIYNGHISLNQLIQFYLNSTLNLRLLTPQIIKWSTERRILPNIIHEVAIVSWT